MTRAFGLVALVLALLVAYHLRTRTAAGHELDLPLADGTTFLVDDPDAAYHLRRVELALASGEVPQTDRFLNHPSGSAVPWPAAFDGALAVLAQVLLERDDARASDELAGYREADLERLLARVPPVLGALAALAIAFALGAFLRGGTRGTRAVAGALAALVFAATPIAVWYGASGRIDHHVAVELLFALELGAVAWAVRSDEATDAWTFALAGGALAGALLLVWLASAVIVAVAGAVLFAAAWCAPHALAAARRRAGGLFFAAAAALVMIPAERSPWNEQEPGSLVNLTLGVPAALLAAVVPFAALELAARLRWRRAAALALAAASTAAVVVLLPGFLDGARAGLDWASRGNEFMAVVAESRPLFGDASRAGVALGIADLGWPMLLLPLALVAVIAGDVASRRVALERWLLIGAALAFALQTLHQRRFGDALAVPMALLLALVVHDLLASPRRVAACTGAALAALLALAAVASGWSVHAVPDAEYVALRQHRRELVEALRWMREGTPSSGPWNAAAARQSYGVLAPWGLGHAIEYHARRPTIATNFGSFVGERGFRGAAEALVETEPATFAAACDALDAAYVVVRARDASDVAALARLARWPDGRRRALFDRQGAGKTFGELALRTALFRLALHDVAVGAAHPALPGFELAHASDRREGPGGAPARDGAASGPVLSVWRRVIDADAAREPSLSPPQRSP